MFGFSFLYTPRTSNLTFSAPEAKRIYASDSYIAVDNMIDKYDKDKVFVENNHYLIILDGVILNKNQIIEKYGKKRWVDTLIFLYEGSNTFFDEFRGSFSGVVYDKHKDRLLVFSDHIGSKFVYYIKKDDSLFVTSMMSQAYDFLRQNSIQYTMSSENAFLLLTYGFMLEDRTLCDNIKKLRSGCYIEFCNKNFAECRYCMLDNTPDYSITENEAIELIDCEFKRVVALEFEKDREYGYKHLVGLSAGLDSRMTSWVAHELGYTQQLNYTFSQSNYWDETIPKKIAEDLKHEWIFKSLDNGLWLYPVDSVSWITGGNVLYYGLAHSLSFLSKFNFNDYGMIHSGQLGDVVLGSWFLTKNQEEQYKLGDGAYSTKYIDKIQSIKLEKFKNQEIAQFYHRGFCGTNNGQLCAMNYTETCSPFMDWDFMNAVMKIPVELRFGHNIYKKWIIAKYPKAADYVWEKIGCKITRKYGLLNIGNRKINLFNVPSKLISKLNALNGKYDKHDMNPIGYYITTNGELSEFIDSYFKEQISTIKNNEVKDILMEIAKSNDSIEKIQAISLLSANKLFFI